MIALACAVTLEQLWYKTQFSISQMTYLLSLNGAHLPSVDEASRFSLEAQVNSNWPVGFHKIWAYLPPSVVYRLLHATDLPYAADLQGHH